MGFWDQMPPGHNNGGPSHASKIQLPPKIDRITATQTSQLGWPVSVYLKTQL